MWNNNVDVTNTTVEFGSDDLDNGDSEDDDDIDDDDDDGTPDLPIIV